MFETEEQVAVKRFNTLYTRIRDMISITVDTHYDLALSLRNTATMEAYLNDLDRFVLNMREAFTELRRHQPQYSSANMDELIENVNTFINTNTIYTVMQRVNTLFEEENYPEAFELLRTTNFNLLNRDLIYGLYGGGWEAVLEMFNTVITSPTPEATHRRINLEDSLGLIESMLEEDYSLENYTINEIEEEFIDMNNRVERLRRDDTFLFQNEEDVGADTEDRIVSIYRRNMGVQTGLALYRSIQQISNLIQAGTVFDQANAGRLDNFRELAVRIDGFDATRRAGFVMAIEALIGENWEDRYEEVLMGTMENPNEIAENQNEIDLNGGRRKVYVAKNGAKYVKNSKGQVRFISGASKTYMEKIRNKRKSAKKSPVKPVRKSAKKTSARAKIHAAIKVAQVKAAKEQKKAAKKLIKRLSKRASKKQK